MLKVLMCRSSVNMNLMKLLTFVLFVVLFSFVISSSPNSSSDSIPEKHPTIYFDEIACSLRYRPSTTLRSSKNANVGDFCKGVYKRYPACKQNLTVSFQKHPPYIYECKKQICGIFKGIIKLASETCCYGCQNIHYVETNGSASSFEQQMSKYDLILPFKNRRDALTFNSHPYVQILTIENIKIFHQKHIQADYLLEILVAGTYETWPLFIIALVMAFSFGAIVWLLDTWKNKENFSRKFPWGVLEGFWWAYVSMTTVGYGDVTPKSFPARIVAIIWISIGIVIFNMYTALLTSTITANLLSPSIDSGYSQKLVVGFLENAAVESAMIGTNWKTRGFKNVTSIIEAFSAGEIKMFALEEHSTYYYQNMLSKLFDTTSYVTINNFKAGGLGMVSSDHKLLAMFHTFTEANEDLIKKMILDIGSIHEKLHEINLPGSDLLGMSFSNKSRIFLIMAITTVIVAILCVVLGTFINRAQKIRRKEKMILLNKKKKSNGECTCQCTCT